jgi:hypothetical protein
MRGPVASSGSAADYVSDTLTGMSRPPV